MLFSQDVSQLSDTSETIVATFRPELIKWLNFRSVQLKTNQPTNQPPTYYPPNYSMHVHGAESRNFQHSVEPRCLLLCSH